MDLALVTFAVEKEFLSWRRRMVSQSFAMASPSPGILDSRERSATVKGPAMAYKRRLDDRGDLSRASGRADHRAVPVTALRSPRSFRDRFPDPHALVTIQ